MEIRSTPVKEMPVLIKCYRETVAKHMEKENRHSHDMNTKYLVNVWYSDMYKNLIRLAAYKVFQ